MATEVLRLVFGDEASAGLDKARGRIDQTRRASDLLKRAVSAAAGALGAGLVAVGRQHDQARAEIARATGASGEALKQLTADYREALGQVRNSSAEVATATGDWNTHLGLTGSELASVTAQALQAGITGDAVAKSFRGAGLGADQARQAIDLLTVLSERYGVTQERIARVQGRYKDRLDALGLSYSEQVTAIAKAESEGRTFSQVLLALEGGAQGLRDQIGAAVPAVDEYSGAAQRAYAASRTLTDRGREVVNWASSLVSVSPEVAQGVGGIAAGLGGLGTLAPQIGTAARLMWAAVAGPVGLVVAAIGAVGVAAWRFREQIGDALAAVVGVVTDRVDSMLAKFEALAERFAPGLADRVGEWRAALRDGGDAAADWLGALGEDVEDAKAKADDATASVARLLDEGSDREPRGGEPALAFQAIRREAGETERAVGVAYHHMTGEVRGALNTWTHLGVQAGEDFRFELQASGDFAELRMAQMVAGVQKTLPPGFKAAGRDSGSWFTRELGGLVNPTSMGGLLAGALIGSRGGPGGVGWLGGDYLGGGWHRGQVRRQAVRLRD